MAEILSDSCEVKLSLINNRVMTFSHDDYMTIRKKFRIMGKLIGAPVAYPRNLQWHGLPAVYSDYDAKLMLEKNLVQIVDKSATLSTPPTDDVKQIYKKFTDDIQDEVKSSYIESRLEATRLKMDQIISGKRVKLLKSGTSPDDIQISPDEVLNEETERLRAIYTPTNVSTHIPNEFPFPSQLTCRTITDIQVKAEVKYRVYKDLWERDFFVTNGHSFGSDFLAYPGDPMTFHAAHIVHVVVDPAKRFNVKYLISCARLSVSVNKKCVFAFVDVNDRVAYQTVEWDNPKLREQLQKEAVDRKESSSIDDAQWCMIINIWFLFNKSIFILEYTYTRF